eukprot:gene2564-21807_t
MGYRLVTTAPGAAPPAAGCEPPGGGGEVKELLDEYRHAKTAAPTEG